MQAFSYTIKHLSLRKIFISYKHKVKNIHTLYEYFSQFCRIFFYFQTQLQPMFTKQVFDCKN